VIRDGKTECRSDHVSMAEKPSGGLSGSSGRAILGEERQGRMLDSKGRIRGRRRAIRSGDAGVFEETGFAPEGKFLELGSITQFGGKIVIAWAVEADCDPSRPTGNLCQVE
jgi:predicted NUDIX family NTP pyrophosphohydrolase